MSLEQIPDFSGSIKAYLRRSEWGDFPDVVIHRDESLVKKHPLYALAKAGDADAAERLVLETITDAALDQINKIVGNAKPYLLAVHALETEGLNAIPRVLAQILSVKLSLHVDDDIIQINRVRRSMESNLKNGRLLPSAIALRNSLSQKPDTSLEQTMLTSYQRELLLQGEKEIDDRLLKELRLVEKLIFEDFYRIRPDFAGRPVHWKPGANPPDILCIDDEGKRIGVELAEWLNEEQMKSSKIREKVEDSFMEAIRSKEIPPPSNIGLVWLSTKSLAPLRQADAEDFRKELLSLIERIDSDWEKNEDRDSPQGYSHQDFSGYPYLDQYLASLRFWSRSQFNTFSGMRWIRFPNQGGAYTPQDAIDALFEVIKKKTSKYLSLHEQESLNELYLLIYYDQGWLYNTPFYAPGSGFSEIAEIAAQAAANNHGVFQKIFLFNSLYGNQEVVQLWPK